MPPRRLALVIALALVLGGAMWVALGARTVHFVLYDSTFSDADVELRVAGNLVYKGTLPAGESSNEHVDLPPMALAWPDEVTLKSPNATASWHFLGLGERWIVVTAFDHQLAAGESEFRPNFM